MDNWIQPAPMVTNMKAPSGLDRRIEIEMSLRIILLLQSLQPGHPPSVIPVQLLQSLVTVRIVHVRVHLGTPVSLMQSFTEVIAKGDSVPVQCAIHRIADHRGSNG